MRNNQNTSPLFTGEIITLSKRESKFGGVYYDVVFKLDSGNLYRSCIYPPFRNFVNWNKLLQVGNVISNLRLIQKSGKVFVSADSKPNLLRKGSSNIRHFKKAGYEGSGSITGELFNG